MEKKYDIYLCYSSEDQKLAHSIYSALIGRGYNIFYAVDNHLEFGGIKNQISDAVKKSTIILYLYTSNSVNSLWCQLELKYAYEFNKNIVPIIFDGYCPDIPETSNMSSLLQLPPCDFSFNNFDFSVTALMSCWLNPILAETAKETKTTQNEIYVTSDRSCRVYRLEEMGVVYKNISTQIQVPEGNHKLMFVDLERESVRVEKNVSMNGNFQEVDIQLLEKYKKSTNSDEIDVFISYNSDDLDYAKEIAEMCKYAGKSYFLADESLKKRGNSAYKIAIDKALAKCRHLVVVVMTLESLKSAWVEYEYQTFHCEKLSGRKDGNLITITGDGITDKNLPIPLSSLQFIPYAQKEDAIEYFK